MNEVNDPLVARRATNNPYFAAIDLFYNRILWDLYPDAWRSRNRLKKSRDSHRDENAVILCNGPSLLKTDFGMLRESGVYTIGLNKINLLFEKTDYRPDAIVAVNKHVIEQNREFYNSTEIDLFIDSCARRKNLVKSRNNVVYIHSSGQARFAKDISMSLYQGYTVTFVALQLAFHLGFKNVSLIGADHDFAVNGEANKEVIAGGADESHFDPRYFSANMKWNLPDLFESEIWYGRAKNMYASHGRKIVNSTVGGKLEVFPRLDLRNFLDVK